MFDFSGNLTQLRPGDHVVIDMSNDHLEILREKPLLFGPGTLQLRIPTPSSEHMRNELARFIILLISGIANVSYKNLRHDHGYFYVYRIEESRVPEVVA